VSLQFEISGNNINVDLFLLKDILRKIKINIGGFQNHFKKNLF